MGIIYSYFFKKQEEENEFEYTYITDNVEFKYNIYKELTEENLILNDIECAENLKRLRIGFVNQNFSNNSGKP